MTTDIRAIEAAIDATITARERIDQQLRALASDGSMPEAYRRREVERVKDELRQAERQQAAAIDAAKESATRTRMALTKLARPLPAGEAGVSARLDRVIALLGASEFRQRITAGGAGRGDVAHAAAVAWDEGQHELARSLLVVAGEIPQDPTRTPNDGDRLANSTLRRVEDAIAARDMASMPPETKVALSELDEIRALHLPPPTEELAARFRLGEPNPINFENRLDAPVAVDVTSGFVTVS